MYSNRVETVIEFVAYITKTYWIEVEDREGKQKESQWETEAKMDFLFFFSEDTAKGESKKSQRKSFCSSVFQSSLCTCPATPCIAFPYW